MVEKWSIPYPAYTGEEPRNVYVYLPDGMDGRERLPVLYMFDGHNVFFDEDATYGTSWGMGAYMDETNTRMMIVAVECALVAMVLGMERLMLRGSVRVGRSEPNGEPLRPWRLWHTAVGLWLAQTPQVFDTWALPREHRR